VRLIVCIPAESAAVQLAGHTDTVACVAIDPSGEVVATGGMDGVTRLWDIASGGLKAALEGPTEAIEWLHWHPKGTVLALGGQDMTSWMFNCTSALCMQVFTGHAGAVMAGRLPTPAFFSNEHQMIHVHTAA
jgi:angio-associated migratory cell protein